MGLGTLLLLGERIVASLAARTVFAIGEKAWPAEKPGDIDKKAAIFFRDFRRTLFPALLEANPWLAERLFACEVPGPPLPVALLSGSIGVSGVQPTVTVTLEIDDSPVDDQLVDRLRHQGRTLEDRPVFRLLGVGENGVCTLGLSSYLKAISTCDVHLLNLIAHVPAAPGRLRTRIYARRRFARRWSRALSSTLDRRLHRISGAVGCSVLTVMARSASAGDAVYFIGESSAKKNAFGERHVVPSFMMQPVASPDSHPSGEADFRVQVLREFAEEMLGHPELESSLTLDSLWSALRGIDACRELEAALDDGRANLVVTGLCLDVLRLRPEFTLLLLIRDPEFFQRHKGGFVRNYEHHSVADYPLSDATVFRDLMTGSGKPLCSPAYVALCLGRAEALRLLTTGRGPAPHPRTKGPKPSKARVAGAKRVGPRSRRRG
jgi:hypothetical protein